MKSKLKIGKEDIQIIPTKSKSNDDLNSKKFVKRELTGRDKVNKIRQPGIIQSSEPSLSHEEYKESFSDQTKDLIQQLISGVWDKEEDQVRDSIQQLVAMGDIVIPDLEILLNQGPDPDLQEFAAFTLGQIETPNAVSVLLKGIKQSTDPALQKNLTKALDKIQGTKSASVLIDALLQEETGVVRDRISNTIARIADAEVVKSLAFCFHEGAKSEVQKTNVLETMSRVCSPSAIPALADILMEDSSAALKTQSAMALGAIGNKDAVYILAAAIEDGRSVNLAPTYAEAMTSISNKDTQSLLCRYLTESNHEYLRLGSALALGNITTKFVEEELEKALSHEKSAKVRKGIEYSLNKIRNTLDSH